MAEEVICKICLNVNVKMYKLEEYTLEDCYKNIMGNLYEETLKSLQYACYECAYFVQKYHLFKQKCIRGQAYLKEILQKSGKIVLTEINSNDRENLKLCSNLTSVINLTKNERNHCDIKIEFDVNEAFSSSNIMSAQNYNFKIEEQMKQEIEISVEEFEGELVFNVPLKKEEDSKSKRQSDKKNSQRKTKFKEVSFNARSNDGIKRSMDKPIKEEPKSISTFTKQACQSSAIKQKKSLETKQKSNGLSKSKEMKLQDYVTVVNLTLQEQIQEILKRKNSSNYLNAEYKCDLCYKGFLDPDAYSHHMRRHDTVSGSKKCPVCKIFFPTQRALQRHSTNHNKNYICKTCSHISKTTTQAKQHQHNHIGKVYKCEQCGNISTKFSSLLTHIRLKHPSEFICDICNYSYVSELGLSRHKAIMHKNRVVPQDSIGDQARFCKPCNVFFNSSQNWKKHVASIGHKTKTSQDFTCGVCKEILLTGEELRVHNRRLHPKKRCVRRTLSGRVPKVWPAKCQHCDTELPNALKYFHHIRKLHPEQAYTTPKNHICDICGKRYRANAFLVYHRRTHFNDRPYKCTQCPKAFFNKVNLQAHEKSHSDQRPFSCTICCKAFKTHGGLQRHFLCHTGEKPYSCELCGKMFSQSNSVKVHVKTVHLKEPAPYVSRSRVKRPGRRPAPARSPSAGGTHHATQLGQSRTNTSFY